MPQAGDTNGRVATTNLPRLRPLVVQPQAGTDTVVVAGRIATNLYAALDSCAATTFPLRARWKLAWSVADIFEYRMDMSRDLRVGDAFRLLFERAFNPADGFHTGPVLAVIFVQSRDTLTAIRFHTPELSPGASVASEYFDIGGRSLRAAFLRAPVEFRRISSGFGMRLHPILKVWREHKGTDYAAPAGTPVRAIGDGTVIFAGQKGGYGNVIDLRHHNGYVTRYGHLLAIRDRYPSWCQSHDREDHRLCRDDRAGHCAAPALRSPRKRRAARSTGRATAIADPGNPSRQPNGQNSTRWRNARWGRCVQDLLWGASPSTDLHTTVHPGRLHFPAWRSGSRRSSSAWWLRSCSTVAPPAAVGSLRRCESLP